MKRNTLAGAATALALLVPAGLLAQSYTIRGERVAIYNLAGEVEMVGGSGGDVSVEVMRGGDDGDELDVQIGEIDGRQTLRVIYPADRIRYDVRGWRGSTEFRIHADGTWGGDDSHWGSRGERVRVSSRGNGLEAHADLRIEVPEGQVLDLYLAVGRITASNVDGRLRLDTHSGNVSARDMAGRLLVDTGSGSVEV